MPDEKEKLLNAIMEALPTEPDKKTHNIWVLDDEILAPSEEAAEAIADFIEAVTGLQMNTSYYEPDNDPHDPRNGYYAVYYI